MQITQCIHLLIIATLTLQVHAQHELFSQLFRVVLPQQHHSPPNPADDLAEERLKKCCAHLNEADPFCLQTFCSFDALSANKVTYYMATCAPRGPTVGQMWDCASSRQDHSQCCQVNNVGSECMVYCDTRNGVPNDPTIYMRCLRYFNPIRTCFRQYLGTHPNLYGDF